MQGHPDKNPYDMLRHEVVWKTLDTSGHLQTHTAHINTLTCVKGIQPKAWLDPQ